MICTLLLAATTLRPVAHWDVVPHQRLAEPFAAGVVAYYDKPFKVEFSVNGKTVATVDKASMNERTKVEEHWLTLGPDLFDPAKLKEHTLLVGAKVVAEDGTSQTLENIPLYWDKEGKVGSRKIIWLDAKDGIDYSEGTKERPVKTMKQAVKLAGDGGTVYLSKPGVYSAKLIGGGNGRKFWTTIRPAPGLARKDVQIAGGRTGCDKLHFKDCQIFCDVTGGQGYALGGVDGDSSCWLEDCVVRNKQGHSAALTYTFGNKLVGYVTGGATTEMGRGPGCKLLRNHVIKMIAGDAFSGGDLLAVNCKLIGVDAAGVTEEPAFHHSPGQFGEWTHDVILAHITATDAACHGFIGQRLKDSVFSDITLETTGPERRYVSRYAWEMQNVWFDRVKVTGQEWVWFKAENHKGDFTPTDVRVTDCSFELPPPEEEK